MRNLRGFWKEPKPNDDQDDLGRTKKTPVFTYLWVPYEDRALAKQRGARWDPARKQWYVKDMVNPGPFLCWMTPEARRASIKNAKTN